MIRRPPRSTQSRSSAASDVYKRQTKTGVLLEEAGADVEGLRGDAQGLGESRQDLGAGLLEAALDLGEVRVADPRHLGQLAQRELGRVALLSQVVAQVVDGDRGKLGHVSIMLALVSTLQAEQA